MTHIIRVFVQWVSHKMDAHWRRKALALRKKQNIREAKEAGRSENEGFCASCGDDHDCICP